MKNFKNLITCKVNQSQILFKQGQLEACTKTLIEAITLQREELAVLCSLAAGAYLVQSDYENAYLYAQAALMYDLNNSYAQETLSSIKTKKLSLHKRIITTLKKNILRN